MLFTSTSVFFCGQLGTDELAATSLSSVVKKLFIIFLNLYITKLLYKKKIINVTVFVPCFGFAMACDTLFPQVKD